MDVFFTWEYLLTMAGCVLATGILTQFIKGAIDKLVHIPTRVLAYAVAFATLLMAQGFTGSLTASSAALDLLNAVLIATAASGAVDGIGQLKGGKK